VRNMIALFVALALAVVAVFGVRQYITREREKTRLLRREKAVVVASQFIKQGVPLKPEVLTKKNIPEDAVSHDHILYSRSYAIIGQTLNQNVERGQPIRWGYLRVKQERVDEGLRFGERAIAIPVDNITGVAGNLRPGSHVDMYGTFTFQEGGVRTGGTATKTLRLLSDVSVIAVDNRTTEAQATYALGGRTRTGYSTVTLALSPTEVGIVIFAHSQGILTLALRHAAEPPATSEPPVINLDNVMQEAQQANDARKERLRRAGQLRAPPPGE